MKKIGLYFAGLAVFELVSSIFEFSIISILGGTIDLITIFKEIFWQNLWLYTILYAILFIANIIYNFFLVKKLNYQLSSLKSSHNSKEKPMSK